MTECEHGVPDDSPTGCTACADAYLMSERCDHGVPLTEQCYICFEMFNDTANNALDIPV